ncbi:hypothetical protein DYB32_002634 [Aphanomyces invadans]|uniref:Uncharacterized protein n=1 Tax=Aphanomyces invadans TaxID=157072 RepID=A0A3R6VQ68_9STRA|nr:hypothetical protein DYB32_002634 [Aphanomyces invadans]
MAAMRPAGYSKKDSEPFGKKKLGRNVEAFIAREEQLSTAMRNTKISNHIKGRAVWEDKQGKRGVTYTRQRVDKQYVGPAVMDSFQHLRDVDLVGRITEEIEMANRELLAIRTERIKAYYTKCYMECVCIFSKECLSVCGCRWERALNARGLALVRERD